MKKEGKNFSLFLGRSDLIGDTVMCEPMLRYFEKLYPNSYKYWHILGKCSQAAPLWFNHPLIDKIKISKNLESYDEEDYEIMKKCDIVINTRPQHKDNFWFNRHDCVMETAIMTGIDINDFNSRLSEDEKFPKLYQWFNIGKFDFNLVGYCKNENKIEKKQNNIISIKPFAGYNGGGKRSCSEKWWKGMVKKLLDLGYEVKHYGFVTEPILSEESGYKKLTHLSFFEQIKLCLDSILTIGEDSGFMWCLGGYSHKSIHLLSNWQPGHITNFLAFAPKNVNSINIFRQNDINLIEFDELLAAIELLK